MEFIGTTITESEFSASIVGLPVFGVLLDCVVDLFYTIGADGEIDIIESAISVGYNYELPENGSWSKEILWVADVKIQEEIIKWHDKKYEEERIQGGF